jgi:hypothetical protein
LLNLSAIENIKIPIARKIVIGLIVFANLFETVKKIAVNGIKAKNVKYGRSKTQNKTLL